MSYAAAQSSPAPANQSGGGISATTPAPTDPGTAGQSGNTKGTPAMGAKQMQKTPMTTGSGMKSAPNSRDSKMETMEKTKSPASQNSGLKKEK
ncbi:MAG: hypothetical protein BGP08_00260 [Rhizobiales bacterium 64-17]|nr:MAG: hypothetical protein BGP08_00260 [Rhizobiales bacterium 64-17]